MDLDSSAYTNHLSQDGRWLLVRPASEPGAKADSTIYLYDVERREYRRVIDPGPVEFLGWFPDSRRILIGEGLELKVLDLETGRQSMFKTLDSSEADEWWGFALSRDGRSLFGWKLVVDSDIWMVDFGEAAEG